MYFSENIIKIMDEICNKIGISIDWGSKNVLPYLEQLSEKIVRYEMIMSFMWLVIGLAVFGLGILILITLHWKSEERPFAVMEDIPTIIGMCFIVLGLTSTWISIEDIVTAKTLPEKTVIDFIMEYKN